MATKKKRKSATFATALVEANRELAKANKRKAAALAELASVNVEIPALQRTIAALTGQVEGKASLAQPVSAPDSYPGDMGSTPIVGSKLNYTDVVPLPEINASMGSIPATGDQPAARELSDEELLQMPTSEDILKTVPKKEDDADTLVDNL